VHRLCTPLTWQRTSLTWPRPKVLPAQALPASAPTPNAHERPDALFVAPDGFFTSRAVQFATLTARDRIPATYSNRDFVALGGLMSYGTDIAEMFRQVGVYTGRILKGEKPAEIPVAQLAKFEFAINLQTAQALGIEVPSGLLSIADEVIE
jgi:putative tryptophan/tyrosine transport system substrate-binding protein